MSNNLRYPVIGIPSWWWKHRALKFAKRHPNVVSVKTEGICYECSRHLDLLSLFDVVGANLNKTEYFR